LENGDVQRYESRDLILKAKFELLLVCPITGNSRKTKALPARFFLMGIKRTEGGHPVKENLAGDAETVGTPI